MTVREMCSALGKEKLTGRVFDEQGREIVAVEEVGDEIPEGTTMKEGDVILKTSTSKGK